MFEPVPAIPRSIAVAIAALLAVAGVYAIVELHAFGQERFFTVDEFQTGHATWLVAQGQLPYVDFYEHHFPLGYTLHAPLLDAGAGDFSRYARRMREISFAYLLLMALTLGACRWAITRDTGEALLTVFVPVSFGFTAMSLIDYRVDNLASTLFLACFALLEANRRPHFPASR